MRKFDPERSELYKFCWHMRRSANIVGLFFADPREVEFIQGKDVYFGEIAGKHSEVMGTVEKGEIVKVELDSAAKTSLHEALGMNLSGHNPIERWAGWYPDKRYDELWEEGPEDADTESVEAALEEDPHWKAWLKIQSA